MTSAARIIAAFLLIALVSLLVGCGASTPPPIAVSLSSSSSAIDQAQTATITASVKNDSKSAGVTWTLSGQGSLGNQSTSAVTYTAPNPVTAAFTATITATSISDASKAASTAITVNPMPGITTQSVSQATAGNSYSATINGSGGSSPFTWSISSGALPTGLSLGSSTSNSVNISGMPTGPGSSSVTIMVKDATGATASQQLTITVKAPAPLTITTTSLAAGVVGTAYNQTVAATGGVPNYHWSVSSGSLPTGLSLNASTGAITGTPTGPQVGPINFTVSITDSQTPSATTQTANLSIAVSAPPLSVTTATLPGGTLGTSYSQTLSGTGGIKPYAWSISAGTLPAGLTLNALTGAITGTPTGSVTGPINFTVKVTDAEVPAGSATAALSITISSSPLSVVTTSLATGVDGSAYSATLQAAGGVSPYSWAVTTGSLPAGLTLSGNTISGTPTGASATFTVTVTDAETPTAQTASKQLTITVNPQLTVTTTTLAAGTVGTSYNQTLVAGGGITPYAWTVTTGSLPAGLSLNGATGAITGKPTGPQVGAISFTVTVTDAESPAKTANANLSITVSAPPLSVTTPSLPGGTLGTSYSQTLAATGGITPYAWSVSAGTLPAGLTLNALTGAITGTPTGSVTGPINFTVKVTDAEVPAGSATAALSITISSSPLSVVTTSLATGVDGSAYSATLQAAGGVSPYSWAVTTGSLPAGLTLSGNTISGTPTGASATFTVTVTDAETPTAQTASKQLTITVNPQLTVTTTTLAAGTVGTSYNQTLVAGGGITPYAWTVTTGSLPAGLSLNGATGAITGKPTGPQVGAISFTVTVTDAESPAKTANANLSITISAPPLSVTTPSLPGGTLGTSYGQTLAATGGITPYAWSVSAGALPAGLTLNALTGAITGTPTGSVTGPINFTVKVTDAEVPAGSATAALSITISSSPLSVVTTSLATGVDGSAYSATLQAAGGVSPYSWAVTTGSLPAGLTLSGNTISGTPTGASATFTVTVTDAETPTAQTASKQLTITVNPQLTVTTTTLAAGTVGTSYNQTLVAGGGITPYAWTVTTGSLPAGLSLNGATGAITGKPTGPQVGAISFTVTVTDAESPAKTANANLSITISAPPLSVTTPSLPGGTLGTSYGQTLAATGGITPYAWSVSAGALPAGLTLNALTGAITGTPTGSVTGPINFTVKVTDAEVPAGSATAALSITISSSPLSVVTTSLATGVDGSAYSATLQAAGGVSPYSWAVTTGSLPAGLTLSGNTISGTPTGASATFTVTVTDAETPTAQTASKQLTITVNPQLTVTTTTLAAGTVGTSYNQTLVAGGGITPYAWTVTTGSLPAGLSLNGATGAITGKPTGPQVGAISFTVTVTDAESPAKTANANLSITISAPALTITTGSEPTGVLNQSYSGSLSATGGITPYTWSISAGSLPPGLTLNASTGAITGTDSTETGTFGFTVQVTDSESPTPSTTTKGLSITINNSAPLQITTTGLPVGVINTSYSNAFLNASGGIQPYTWSYTGSLPPGLTLNTSTGQISGTPTSTGTFSFTAKVTDSSSPVETATAGLSITVDGSLTITTTSVPNGSVNTQYNATANASGGILPYNWNLIGGSLPPGLNYGTNNNSLNISGQPTTTGTYPFTMQVTDNQGDTASQGYTIVIGTEPAAYTVSGTVSYSGSKTGWVYLQLQPNGNNCGNCGNNLGTSISEATLTSGGAFTIHGVQPGTYTLQAYMDNLGYGAQNASNPTGSVSNVTVTASPVTGVGVTLADPGTVTISSAPSWNSGNGSGAFSGGAFVSFQSIQNNNGIEMPASYTVEWSTSSSCSSPAGSKSFPASGGNNPWIVNGLTNGTTYYFCARGVAGSSTGPWSAPSSGITINAPSGGNAVSGKVTFSETAKGPLYVGFYNQSTGQIYADVVGSQASPPTSPASYTVSVPTGSNYYFFGILDQNNSGLIAGPGQVSNTNENNMAPVSISGTTTNENLTLPSANSIAVVRTQSTEQINSDGTSTNYSIGFNVNGLLKLPVAVELTSGPTPGVVMPADIADGGFNGNSDQFSYWTSLNGATPKVGDSYSLKVTYSDGTSETLTATVGAVLNAFATNLSPQGSGVSATPNFSWTDPANASSYTYQFWLCCDSNGTIWQIPGNNSKSNGFSSSINSITWGVDPTNSGNLPNVSSLNGSTNYSWQIQATDVNGNSAQVQVNFETVETPLSLPAAGSVGNAVVGQSWGGAINASGGVPNYTFTVNGNTVPTDGTQVSLGDNLYAWNTGGNTLSLGGTPTTATTVSFTVGVTDSSSPNQTAGPFTYSITVSAAAALSIETLSLPGGNNGWAYTTSVKATGGVQPYTWSIISGSLPGGLSPSSNGGSNLTIAGTPSATGTTSFTVQVEDSESPPVKVSQALSITITNCTYTALNGNYAFESNGWDSSGTTTAASAIGSFVANGAGTISSGLIDVSDQANVSGPQSGTVTGTYCVGPNNLAVINLTYGGGLSGGNIFAASLDSSDGNGHIISYDSSNLQASGLLRKQTTSAFSTSKIDGNYAFGLVGVDQNASRFGLAGEFSSNGSGTLSGQADYDQSCSGGCGSGSSGNTTLSSSNFTVASTGRGTAGMYITAPAVTVNFVFYVVSSSEMLMMAYDNTETPSMVFAGQVLQQSASLTDASLNGNSVIELVGLDNSNSQAVPDVQAGLINASGTGTFTLTMDENDGGTFDNGTGSPSPISGDYSVGTGGRVTLSNITGCPGGCGGHSPIFYLVGLNKAFVIDTSGEVSVGTITPQTGSSFTQASFNGNYLNGSQPPVIADNGEEVDSFAANGAGTFNVTTYKNSGCDGCGSPQLGAQAISGLDYTVSSNGRVVVTCGPTTGANCGPSGTEVGIIYMISTSQGVFFITQDSNPRLMDYHQ